MSDTHTKKTIFRGAATAIVTPFKNDRIDYEAFGKLLEYQIKNQIDAIVVCGTTGESATLSDSEHREIISYAVEKAAGRIPVIAGTGSNETAYSVELSKHAAEAGADALLLVTPYYNKASEKGLIKHFQTIAESTDKPVILYNVPSRTGTNISMRVYRELAKHPQIVAVKEASGDFNKIAEIAAECGDMLDIYSGNDNQIVPILSLGGKGVISVLSNIMPKETHDMCQFFFDGNVQESTKLHLKLLDLINALFIEVNPIPIKTAMGLLGYFGDQMRLPLCEMEDANKEKLCSVLKKHGLL